MDKLELGKQLFEQNLELDYYLPKREDIQNFSVGQWAVNCFGELGIITDIFGRGYDVNGLAYICYYTQLGEHSTISHSLKENKLVRTLPLCNKFKSFELDAIEAYLVSREKQPPHCDYCHTNHYGYQDHYMA